VIGRLQQALQAAQSDPAFVDSMKKLGAMPVGAERATPAALEQKLKSQVATWTPLIQQSQGLAQ